jgi:hypothetical protein
MIQWQTLQAQLQDYFEKGASDKNRTYEQTAFQIETLYRNAVLGQGQDQFGNVVVSMNKFMLAASLSRGFKDSLLVNVGLPLALNGYGLAGLPQLWAGGQLSLTVPPPSSVSVISNVVVNPGIFPSIQVGGPGTLLQELMKAFQQHVKTVNGMTTALVSTGTTLVPVQFPWTGIV